jgi:hypothetical protein
VTWLVHLQQRWDALIDAGVAGNLLNGPMRVKTRLPLLREFHAIGINDFDVYPIDRSRPLEPRGFPVFIPKRMTTTAPLSS